MLNNEFENVAQVLPSLELRHVDALEDILVSLMLFRVHIFSSVFQPVDVLDLNTTGCVRPMAKPKLGKIFPNERTRLKERRSPDAVYSYLGQH